MRVVQNINKDWTFIKNFADIPTTIPAEAEVVSIPHTWNGVDGQDGGNDYFRGSCCYVKTMKKEELPEGEKVFLEINGANSSAKAYVNGKFMQEHHGGYSTWRMDITNEIAEETQIVIIVDNAANEEIYPQTADFTFYGGIYRDVNLVAVPETHFDLTTWGTPGIKVTPVMNGADCNVEIEVAMVNAQAGDEVIATIEDAEGVEVAQFALENGKAAYVLADAHLWDGVKDPYLYTAKVNITREGTVLDSVSTRFGCRSFEIHPENGFILNGREYPLRGVSRHQDRWEIGNALLPEHHIEDMDFICEMGANTIRLAHYQHDQYFYDLCDKYGMIVWAEIPYISEHMPGGRENTVSQMKELIVQCYNHPSICVWGISNEITISTTKKADMMDNHKLLNDLIHEMDPSRPTTLACYAMCAPFDAVGHISDVVSWNLYLGWYTPFMWLNNIWVDYFHRRYPNRCLGYSEYGCECMPNLHSSHPKRGDQTEEYQCKYNEFMLNFFEKRPFMWATHLWNMFDFAADARNQGGEPGMNHKGLVTFDRKIKKDSFYLYKAWWSKDPFVYICGRRYKKRAETMTTVKVYSNCPEVTLFVNGKKVATKAGNKVFTFRIPLTGKTKIQASYGKHSDQITIYRTDKPDPSYKLSKKVANGGNWT